MKVVISKGYGIGWSTWSDPAVATDPAIVEAVEKNVEIKELVRVCHELGYSNVDEYCCDGLTIEEVPAGAYFQIREYDGAEWIEIFDPNKWILAD